VKKIYLLFIVLLIGILFAGCRVSVRTNLNAPTVPDNLGPVSGTTEAETTMTLTWSVSVDPKGGTVYYDVYMGTTETPPVIAMDLTSTSYQVVDLENETTYYWRVVAKNEVGDSVSSQISSLTTKAAPLGNAVYRGLSLGLTDYGGSGDLSATDDDAEEIKVTFENLSEDYSIQKETGRVVKVQIQNWLTTFVSDSKGDDVFVFHYSGHGFYERGQSRMYLSDGSDMSMSELRGYLDQINGTKIVLIDACQSGNFTNMSSGRIMSEEEMVQQTTRFREGVLSAFEEAAGARGTYSTPYEYYVLTGCAVDEYSNEDGYLNHGFFSFFFCDGLGNVGVSNPSGLFDATYNADGYGPDGLADGKLTHSELYHYSKDKVSSYFQSTYGENTQTIQGNHTDSDFIVGIVSQR